MSLRPRTLLATQAATVAGAVVCIQPAVIHGVPPAPNTPPPPRLKDELASPPLIICQVTPVREAAANASHALAGKVAALIRTATGQSVLAAQAGVGGVVAIKPGQALVAIGPGQSLGIATTLAPEAAVVIASVIAAKSAGAGLGSIQADPAGTPTKASLAEVTAVAGVITPARTKKRARTAEDALPTQMAPALRSPATVQTAVVAM